jgi:von Willebrand factor
MNVDDPKLTAYALDELDEPERSAIARSVHESPELQRFVAETQEFTRALRSEYALELERGLEARRTLTSIQDDGFWSTSGPLAIAAIIAVLAVIGAVMLSSNQLQTAAVSRSNLPEHLAEDRAQANQFAAVEAQDAAHSSSEKFGADAGPYAFTGERPFVSVISRPRSSVPLIVDSASYVDVRRSIDSGLWPRRNAVRIEELINQFPYDYPPPPQANHFR